ncbi:kynureninase [Winogradskyella vincentii]|uniref:Kynureninase n=1 Tax=Winogradskyella vincentii TaxID=2877122 RepID=A0ABS7XZ86_9FLAO|nr:kynureninase [Winogradskyella vincentii]MCA0151798.1 kynureninase [Winogradskyella vincentii]
MTNFKTGLDFALELDRNDKLSHFRNQFHIPKHTDGKDCIYLCGNSLGLQPRVTQSYINQELKDWAELGVEGHVHGKNPWLSYHELLTDNMASIVGAKPIEVVVMNTLTTNLHLMMVSFYKPTKKRYKIVIEGDAFPSDKYAVESQLRHHGYDDKEGLISWNSREGEELLRYEDLEKILERYGDEIALIMVGGVNYYTGQFFDLKRITELGHMHGCVVGFDCAHGAGNVNLDLHNSGADFAIWCSYKYLNSGPGSLSGVFVHERHAYNKELNRFTGWWSHNKETRFKMRDDFDMLPGAEGWQLSNPPILSMAAIKASLDVFAEAGMDNLVAKSKDLTAYFEFLLNELNNDNIKIITPSNENERGCQLSIQVKNADRNLNQKLTKAGIISDWREPDVIRCAPVPLYNSFEDIYNMVERLKLILNEK